MEKNLMEWFSVHENDAEGMAFELFGAAHTVWDDFVGGHRTPLDALDAMEALDRSFPGGNEALAAPWRLLVACWVEDVYTAFVDGVAA